MTPSRMALAQTNSAETGPSEGGGDSGGRTGGGRGRRMVSVRTCRRGKGRTEGGEGDGPRCSLCAISTREMRE